MSGEKFKVTIKFNPGVPQNINEMFLVEIAHFPAERFKIKAVGTYPGCLLTFPRQHNSDYTKRYQETEKSFENGKIDYNAAFSSNDIKIVAPTKTKKGKDTQVDLPTDSNIMEIEAETDRRYLCKQILGKYNEIIA